MFKQSLIFILSIFLSFSPFFFTRVSVALAFEKRTSSVTSPYSFYQDETKSTWDPNGGSIQAEQGLISRGNIDVLHRGEAGIEKTTVSVGDTVPFIYYPDNPFFTASGGLWDTPYGSWCTSINDRCFGDITSVGLYITSNYGNGGYLYFTGVKPPVELISSNPTVLSCSGLSCQAKMAGQSQVTMKVGYTPIRAWARIHYKSFGVFSPQAVSHNSIPHVSVWSDASEIGAPVTAYSYTNPKLVPGYSYYSSPLSENVTLSKSDFIASSEGVSIISNLNQQILYDIFICWSCSSAVIINDLGLYDLFEQYLPGSVNQVGIQKIVDDALASGKGWNQDVRPGIIAALPENVSFSKLVPLQNQGYNDMVLPKTTLGPWTITVEGPLVGKHNPNPPIVPNTETEEKVLVTIPVSATDPDDDQVKYCVDWNNDGDTTDTTPIDGRTNGEQCYPSVGFVDSGVTRNIYQTWDTEGTKTFQVRTVDQDGNTSTWTSAQVVVKKHVLPNSCTVNESTPCLTGLPGACSAGKKVCPVSGSWTGVACQSITTPGTEICGNGIDEDCNGSDLACPTTTPSCNTNGRCEKGEGKLCPDCRGVIIETEAPKPSFWASLLGVFGGR
jgi:hypothetical protein